MHGCAPGSGAPKGNRNNLRHGFQTAEAVEMRRELRALIKASRETVELI
jgi:hypothetical protein